LRSSTLLLLLVGVELAEKAVEVEPVDLERAQDY
jgi:hypothetical protein